jgi:hypothetical protein
MCHPRRALLVSDNALVVAALEVAALVVACAPAQDPATGTAEDGGAGRRGELVLDAQRPVACYAWRDGLPIPWVPGRASREVVLGELGRGRRPGLYLTFDSVDPAAEAGLQPEGWETTLSGLASAPGRFGNGARLDGRSVVRCALPDEARAAGAWSIEFWIRPDRVRAGALLSGAR